MKKVEPDRYSERTARMAEHETKSANRSLRQETDLQLPTELYSLRPRAFWLQLKREHISFWLACGYLFFEYVRPQTIYPSIDFLPWAMLFVAGAFITSFSARSPTRRGSALSALIVLYGLIVLLSSTFGYNPSYSFQNLGSYFNWVIIYFMIIRTVRTREQFFIFFTLYMLCNFKMTQHGFLTWASLGFAFESYGIGGAPGWFQNSGEFGIQLCIFTPLIVAFVLAVKPHCNKFTRYILYFIPFTAVASVIASASRGALVGLAAAGLWSLRVTKHFFRTVVVMAVVGGAVYLAIPEESKARFRDSGTDRTSLVRIDRWEKGWQTMKEHPLLGIGHKNWEQYYGDNLNYGIEGTRLVHSMFIESGTEHGFLGLGVLIFLLVWMFVENAKTRAIAKRHGDLFSVYVAHGMDAATVGMVISSCFVTVLYYPYVWIHAAFVASLSISARGSEPVSTKSGALEPSRETSVTRFTKRSRISP